METDFVKKAKESGEEIEDGFIWHSYAIDGYIVQIPREGDEWRVDRVDYIYDQLNPNSPVPEIVEINNGNGKNSGVVFEKIEGEMFRTLKNRLEENNEETEEYNRLRKRYLEAVEDAGKALAYIHESNISTEGFGYFELQDEVEFPFETWEGYVEDKIDNFGEVPDKFDEARTIAFENFDIKSMPESPDRGILHEDYNSGNIFVEDENTAKVIDLDNAIVGDTKFGFINSKNELLDYDDKKAHERFAEGYESVREISLTDEQRDNYVALAIINSIEAGKWLHENRDVDFLEDYAKDVTGWANNYFD